MLRFIGLCLCCFLVWPSTADDFLGPADIHLKRIEKCGDDKFGLVLNLTMHKINRTHQGVDAEIHNPLTFGDGIAFNATLYKWGDGGWKANYQLADNNSCAFFMKYGQEKFAELLRFNKAAETCPVAPGEYRVKDYAFDGKLGVPILYGESKAQVIFTNQGEPYACVDLYYRSDPKKSFY